MNNILMNVEMTKKILNNMKTETRRVIKSHIDIHNECNFSYKCENGSFRFDSFDKNYFCNIFPPYKKEEILWIREPVQIVGYNSQIDKKEIEYVYKSDNDYNGRIPEKITFPERLLTDTGELPSWVLKYHSVPNGCIKEMARIFIKITDIKVERLQDCNSIACFEKEGIYQTYSGLKKEDFETVKQKWITLWNSTSSKKFQWSNNPFVFVFSFEVINMEKEKFN